MCVHMHSSFSCNRHACISAITVLAGKQGFDSSTMISLGVTFKDFEDQTAGTLYPNPVHEHEATIALYWRVMIELFSLQETGVPCSMR